MKFPAIREKLAAQGLEATRSTPGEVTPHIRNEVARWTQLIRKPD